MFGTDGTRFSAAVHFPPEPTAVWVVTIRSGACNAWWRAVATQAIEPGALGVEPRTRQAEDGFLAQGRPLDESGGEHEVEHPGEIGLPERQLRADGASVGLAAVAGQEVQHLGHMLPAGDILGDEGLADGDGFAEQ